MSNKLYPYAKFLLAGLLSGFSISFPFLFPLFFFGNYIFITGIISRKFSYLPDINNTNKNIYHYLRSFFSFLGVTIRIPILVFFLIIVTYYSYSSIQKNDLSFVNNHSNKIKNEYMEIKSNPIFENKQIFYTSLDNNLISSYFRLTDIKFNSYLQPPLMSNYVLLSYYTHFYLIQVLSQIQSYLLLLHNQMFVVHYLRYSFYLNII